MPNTQAPEAAPDAAVVRSTVVAAPADVVYDTVADVARWPQLLSSVVHVEHTPGADPGTDEVEIWALRGENQVRNWTNHRTLDRDALRIGFANPLAEGEWRVEARDDGTATLTVSHDFAVPAAARGAVPHIEAQLAEFQEAAERHAELAELTIEFADPLFIGGAPRDAYELLYRAEQWPDRFPHVTRIDMTEDVPNVQFFDMDTLTPDGRPHTTRSVRICFPHGKIVYKQISLAPLLTAHTGHWVFEETPEGTLAEARHTATIDPANLELLKPGATVQDARAYLRRVLSANSVANLRFAKEYAEDIADNGRKETVDA
ncbi:aromatase/cyclase [Streptomyces varsoviensis]|uniref:aromatase/cyclase n=1 Tax=Streptomyces varsoviensis TaxID=67373 RepID=UPI003409BC4F